MKIVNLFGGPGVGKSTIAARLFSDMKEKLFNVELRTEYAKDLYYEGRNEILQTDQFYVLAKQNRKLQSLLIKGEVDYVVTDAPLLASAAYNSFTTDLELFETFTAKLFNSYDNINILLCRSVSFEYNSNGRSQKNLSEATAVDKVVSDMVRKHCKSYHAITVNNLTCSHILDIVTKEI